MSRHYGFDDEPKFEKFEKRVVKSGFSVRSHQLIVKQQKAIQSSHDNQCNKQVYISKGNAELAMRRINTEGDPYMKMLQEAYRCGKCGHYHLTSAPTQRKPKEVDRLMLSLVEPVRPAEPQQTVPAATVQELGKNEANPVLKAVLSRNLDALERLIKDGQTVNVVSPAKKSTPLHTAAASGHAEIANMLIAAGAKINFRNKSGKTPLHTAASSGHSNLCDVLLAAGGDISIRDNKGKTAVESALESNHLALHARLASLLPDWQRIHGIPLTPSQAGALYTAKTTTATPSPPQLKVSIGSTELHTAALAGNLALVRRLLDNPETNAAKRDLSGGTALHSAVMRSHLTVAIALACADRRLVNINDTKKNSPLHVACGTGNLSVCEFLLAIGADIHARNMYKATPLHQAAKSGHVPIYGLLLDAGADSGAVCSEGKTPAELAAAHPNFQVKSTP